MMRTHLALVAVLLLAPTTIGSAGAAERLRVTVSVLPQVWLVEAIAGDRVEVDVLLAPGESPETYQPTDAQVSSLMRSTLFIRLGVPFEEGRWFQALAHSDRLTIVDSSQGIERRAITGGEHRSAVGRAGKDPHIWLSPKLTIVQARTVARALAEIDPEHRADYDRRLLAVIKELEHLDRTLHQRLDPHRGRAFLVFHPSWGYFADEYGLRQIAIELDGKQPTDRELTAIHEAARRDDIHTVFVQPQISGRAAQAVADAIGAKLEIIDPLGADLPVNLLQVADLLAESFRP